MTTVVHGQTRGLAIFRQEQFDVQYYNLPIEGGRDHKQQQQLQFPTKLNLMHFIHISLDQIMASYQTENKWLISLRML